MLPLAYMMAITTQFTHKNHGFRFPNAFAINIHLPLRTQPWSVNTYYGLCGGMCFAALDYYYNNIPIPSLATQPQHPSAMFWYLVKRQIHSFRLMTVPIKVIYWMFNTDNRLLNYTVNKVIPELESSLSNGNPVVLALIRQKGWANPTNNHQVIVTGIDTLSTQDRITLHVYDPNHPFPEQTEIHINLNAQGEPSSIKQTTHEPLRGFFIIPYRPQQPPDMSE